MIAARDRRGAKCGAAPHPTSRRRRSAAGPSPRLRAAGPHAAAIPANRPRQRRLRPHVVAGPRREARGHAEQHARPEGACTEGRELADKKPTGTTAEWLGQEDAFDLWLRRSLHEAFDPALEEPVPEEVLRLIEEDRAERERIRRRRAAGRGG